MQFIIVALFIRFYWFSAFMKKIGHHLADQDITKGAIFYLSAFESLNILTIFWFLDLRQSLGLPIMIVPYLFLFYQLNSKYFIKNGKYKRLINEYSDYTAWQRKMSTMISIIYTVLSVAAPIIYNEFFK